MDVVIKDLLSRKSDIEEELEALFNSNMTIMVWNIPEPDNRQAAEVLVQMLQDKLNGIKSDVEKGKYDYA